VADGAVPRVSRRLFTSTRLRVTAGATFAVVGVLAGAGLVLVRVQHTQLVDRVDETNVQRMSEIATDLHAGRTGAITELRGADVVAQVVDGDGRIVSVSPDLRGAHLLAGGRAFDGIRTVHDVPLESGEYRVINRRVSTPEGPVTVFVGGSLDDVDESTEVIARSLLVGIPVVAGLLAVVVWLVVGRLLGRVERATTAQQRFVADASHELRTPLARMRAELEVDDAHPDTADAAATRHSLLDETVALQHLADDLLLLARSDAGGLPDRHQLLDFDAVVADESAALASRDGLTVRTHLEPAQVRGDASQLGRAVRNVLENAVRHARSTVGVDLQAVDGRASLRVVDDGPGIAPADRERVFERFTRLDDARSVSAGGSGLGLAITREIVEQGGGRVWIESPTGGGTAVCISFPAVR
jgi:signal transduction histidine kinase